MEGNIEQFRQKATLCLKEYSPSRSCLMLQNLCDVFELSPSKINTIGKLKKTVSDHTSDEIPESSLPDCLLYCRWFLDTHEYIKQLKLTFNDLVLNTLMKEASVVSAGSQRGESASVKLQKSDTLLSYENDVPEIKELFDKKGYDNILVRLKYINDRLNLLLEEDGNINEDLFTWKSIDYHNETAEEDGLQNLVRLVPDCLIKCQTIANLCMRLHKIQIQQNTEDVEQQEKLERVQTFLSEKLNQLTEDCYIDEERLDSETEYLQELIDLENVTAAISTQVQSVERRLQNIEQMLDKLSKEINDIQDLSKNTDNNNQSFQKDLNMDVRKRITERDNLTRSQRLLKYQLKLLNEDLNLQLELKPSIIRLTDGLQEHCELIEAELRAKREEKFKLEQALTPIKQTTSMVDNFETTAENSSTTSSGEQGQKTPNSSDSQKNNDSEINQLKINAKP